MYRNRRSGFGPQLVAPQPTSMAHCLELIIGKERSGIRLLPSRRLSPIHWRARTLMKQSGDLCCRTHHLPREHRITWLSIVRLIERAVSILSMSTLRTDRPSRLQPMNRLLRERPQCVRSHCELEGRSDEGLRDIELSRAELDFKAPKASRWTEHSSRRQYSIDEAIRSNEDGRRAQTAQRP